MTYAGRDYSPDAIAARLFNTPLMVSQAKLNAIMGVLGPKFDVARLVTPEGVLVAGDLAAAARAEKVRVGASRFGGGEPRRIFTLADGVAVIPVRGTLVQRNGLDPFSGMTGYDGIWQKLDAAEADPEVRGIVLDIDSPGGEVAGCFDLADRLSAVQKPTRAILTESACSAAYALACCCDEIWMPRTGFTGSIGVIAMHTDFSRHLDDHGISVTLIYAGPHKADGNPYEPLPDDVRDDFQAEIEGMFALFAGHVAAQRDMSADDVMALESRAFPAEAAIAAGLADRIASPREAMADFLATLDQPSPPAANAAAGNTGETGMDNLLKKSGGSAAGKPRADDGDEDENKTYPEGQEPDEDQDKARGEGEEDDGAGDKAEEEEDKPEAGRKAGGMVVPLKADAAAQARSDATAIADICTLAGCPERASAFLEANASPNAVANTLLKERADRSAASSVNTAHDGGIKPQAYAEGDVMRSAHKKAAARRF